MPATGVSPVRDRKTRIQLTGNIKLCGPHATLCIRERSSSAVRVLFEDGTARAISAIGAVVGTRLLTVGCLGAAG